MISWQNTTISNVSVGNILILFQSFQGRNVVSAINNEYVVFTLDLIIKIFEEFLETDSRRDIFSFQRTYYVLAKALINLADPEFIEAFCLHAAGTEIPYISNNRTVHNPPNHVVEDDTDVVLIKLDFIGNGNFRADVADVLIHSHCTAARCKQLIQVSTTIKY